jgi:hypothetical protein
MFAIVFISFGCKETGFENKDSSADISSKFLIDYVIEEDSAKIFDSVMMKYSSNLLMFPNLKDERLRDSIYSGKKITDYSKNGLKKYLENKKYSFYNNLKCDKKYSNLISRQEWENISQMNLRMNKNDYLYIQYYESTFLGKRDNYHYNEKVFDLRNNKKMQLSDITSIPRDKLLQYLKTNLEKTTMMQQMKKYDQEGYRLLANASIPFTHNFYFDDNNLYFHYNMNEITRNYDIGDLIILIPFEDLKGTLQPEFIERMKIK